MNTTPRTLAHPPVITTGPADLVEAYRFRHRLVLAAAEHAVAVYEDPAHYGYIAVDAGFTGGRIVERWGAQVGIAWSPEVIQVTPRGSSQAIDWIGDLLSVFRAGWSGVLPSGARAGFGWLRQAKRISKLLLRHVHQVQNLMPDAEVVVAGHSLGGAMVPLLVAYLRSEGIITSGAFLLEPPRPGNATLAKWYDGRFTKGVTPTRTIINVVGGELDLVTRVPMRRFGSRHLGDRFIYTEDRVFRGERAWQLHRAANPVGTLAGWRFLSRNLRAARAHRGSQLLATLRAERPGEKNS